MKIVYMGTPEFALPALKKLIESNHEVAAVVCQPDRKAGRGKNVVFPPVKEFALEKGLNVLQPERLKENLEFFAELEGINPDIIVVAAYGRIIPKKILELPKYGCINIHGSLLPKYRGASPIQTSILMGDDITGVTIMKMAEGLDTGDMIAKAEIEIDGMDSPTLSNKLAELGGELLIEVLADIEDKGEVVADPQDESLATFTKLILKEDGRVIFAEKEAAQIERMIRAYEPWPGVYSYIDGEILKYKKVIPFSERELVDNLPKDIYSNYQNMDCGMVLGTDKEGIFIKAKDSVLKVTEIQPQGKKPMDAGSYLRGHRLDPGTAL